MARGRVTDGFRSSPPTKVTPVQPLNAQSAAATAALKPATVRVRVASGNGVRNESIPSPPYQKQPITIMISNTSLTTVKTFWVAVLRRSPDAFQCDNPKINATAPPVVIIGLSGINAPR